MNNYMEQLWGLPSAPLWSTSTWRTLRPRPLAQLYTLPVHGRGFVDDTFVVIESSRKEEFLDHINNLDPHIQFTTEDAKPDGSLPFLDTLVQKQPDNSLLTSVYRKPTHTDLYLQWDSHHHLSAKYSVINTLRHRAKTVCSNHHLLKEEEDHLNRALSNCRYPTWALHRARINTSNKNKNRRTYSNTSNKKPYIVVP